MLLTLRTAHLALELGLLVDERAKVARPLQRSASGARRDELIKRSRGGALRVARSSLRALVVRRAEPGEQRRGELRFIHTSIGVKYVK